MTLTWIMYVGDLVSSCAAVLQICMVLGLVAMITFFAMIVLDDYPKESETQFRAKSAKTALVVFLTCITLAALMPSKETVRVAQIEYLATSTPVSKVVYRVAKWLDAAILPTYAEKE
ncbi:MAG: hypothetical protein UX75_C0059G0010 [Candidatus Moranbacteria bacterium GW2011_GWE2_47_10]|nr:MAG: hypothetical protein UX75_C0059G0010 [Candidatus Moranbacteria bacterium GW2011_GWE2_47_10]